MKAPIRLILARHGNTFEDGQTPTQVGARTDLPLTLKGQAQAELISRHLLTEKITPAAIYAGGLKRQTESAQIIADRLDIHQLQLYEPALTEIDYGAWEGLTSEEITNCWSNEYINWTEKGMWPEKIFGGKMQNHINQIELWLNLLRQTYVSGDTIVAITSNGLLRFFYSLQAEQWQQLKEKKQIDSLKVKTGHFCELHLFPDSLKIISWNVKPLYIL
jgi:broad specificity phosphatase PhoE